MAEYADVKPGDLLLYKDKSGLLLQSVIIGFFDSVSVRIRDSGFDGETYFAPMFIYTIKADDPEGIFCWVTRKRWNSGIVEDHVPREKNHELSKTLLEKARSRIKQSYGGACDYFKPNEEDRVFFTDVVKSIDDLIMHDT
jgi:hypothetical protein